MVSYEYRLTRLEVTWSGAQHSGSTHNMHNRAASYGHNDVDILHMLMCCDILEVQVQHLHPIMVLRLRVLSSTLVSQAGHVLAASCHSVYL